MEVSPEPGLSVVILASVSFRLYWNVWPVDNLDAL